MKTRIQGSGFRGQGSGVRRLTSAFRLLLPVFCLLSPVFCLLSPCLLSPVLAAAAPLELLPTALVDSRGIFLHQLVRTASDQWRVKSDEQGSDEWPVTSDKPVTPYSSLITSPPHPSLVTPSAPLRLAEAPLFGQVVLLTRAQLQTLGQQTSLDLATNGWAGAAQVRVGRRARSLGETELREWLTATLQREQVKDKGELELRLGRPWTPVSVPDETLTLRVLDLPATGVSANFIVRFEILCGPERLGPWQLMVQGRLMKEVLVAHTALKRGQTLAEADVTTERRDVTTLREPLDVSALTDTSLEINEGIAAGQPLLARSVRLRPVVLRGQLIEALMQDGTLSISLKVEDLSDGLPGQTIRVRNPKTKREFLAKVQNDQTVLLSL